ncbi:ATP-binding cassette domain-containing protein [Amphritea opalescens]|uniref:ATP-binding cassette domain-containing protein n=1 Tax=Amphritea opalescens TaxID=2490544 RepID=A0A430KLW8_9GAMM|nr:ATP-binding cassette domain-containing protein [Amphritea opalescens]RTE64456.1 ATP-binding cassette domain-containing protein [Amphritea opalescens]
MLTPEPRSVLIATDLAKTFPDERGGLNIFNHINIRADAGESVAIIGPSGAGKSTLLSILAGLDEPSEGTIELLGQPLTGLDEASRAELRANHISFVFQSFQLLPELSALDNVQLALEIQGHPNPAQQAGYWLDRVGLSHRHQHTPARLSGGEQQRVAIARAFATEPSLLFADEPTGNLDEKTGTEIIEQLFELNRQLNTTLILITHDASLAQRCQRRLYLHNGTLQEQ